MTIADAQPGSAQSSHARADHVLCLPIAATIIAIHLLALIAPFFYSTAGLTAFLALYLMTGFGITLAFHRYLTHKSFRMARPAKIFWVLTGTLALQGGPISWVATHRMHHARSDQPGDPHSPKDGFWWSHLLWNFYIHPELTGETYFRKYARDMYDDPDIVFLEKWFIPINIAFGALLYGIGHWLGGWQTGLSMLFWAGFLRIVAVWHITWAVNSATHLWGYRRYVTTDTSRNNWFVAWFGMGEGWHNNHHADQRAARNGHAWYEFDPTYYIIKAMSLVGLASHLVPVSGRLVREAQQGPDNAKVVPLEPKPKSRADDEPDPTLKAAP